MKNKSSVILLVVIIILITVAYLLGRQGAAPIQNVETELTQPPAATVQVNTQPSVPATPKQTPVQTAAKPIPTIAPSITITTPNGDVVLRRDSSYSIRWTYTGLDDNDMIRVALRDSNENPCWLGSIAAKMRQFDFIPTNCGTASSPFKPGLYKAQVGVAKYDTGMGVADTSDYFTIN